MAKASKTKVKSINPNVEAVIETPEESQPHETRFEWERSSQAVISGEELIMLSNLAQLFSATDVSDYEKHLYIYQIDKILREQILPRNVKLGNVKEVPVN
jgi:hypothetical protein